MRDVIDLDNIGIALVELGPRGMETIAISSDLDLIQRAARVMAEAYGDLGERPATSARAAMAVARIRILQQIAGDGEAEGELIAKPATSEPAWWPTLNADKEVHQSEQ
jgi:hypothetical protein